MTGSGLGGVVAAFVAIAIWIAVGAKQAGASNQATKDAELAHETEATIHEDQPENLDNVVTIEG
jgi:hypothetical protein